MQTAMIGKIKLYIERKLSRKEQAAVYAAAGVILLLLVVQLVIAPLFAKRTRMQLTLRGKITTLEEIRKLSKEYAVLKQNSDSSSRRIADREKEFTLFSFLDKLSGTVGVKDKISYMKPSVATTSNTALKKSSVEMELRNISVEQLTNFLHGIETSGKMVSVKRLSATKKDKQDAALVVVLQAETFES